ncbi:MAG TPA: hydroxymethylbilane synthase [Pyrinomonadaceae bacterium]
MRVTIASRRSDLARIQAYQVADALSATHPHIEINYSFHESLGDKNQSDPLWQMPEKGVFTQDFREGLLNGEFDLVVHSWKDLAIENDPETEVIATLPRADARDLLLVPRSRWSEAERTGVMTILTSSPRRAHNLDSFLRAVLPAKITELNFTNVRGNVPTRVRKLLQSDVDGLVVAKAAIDRLLAAPRSELAATQKELREALSQCRWMVLPLRENPSAPAQGALAVEISRERADIRELLGPLNCSDTFSAVLSEREILRSHGGGCHQKIGASVLRRPFGEITLLRGLTDSGELLDRCTLVPAKPRPPKISREEMWPLDLSDADFFVREPRLDGDWSASVPLAMIASATSASGTLALQSPPFGLWIAKADALPDHWNIEGAQIVWASGVQTWKRLARRGVWVNGCAESLGEQESPRIETLAGAPVRWLKLTHESGYTDGEIEALATYRLVPKEATVDLSGKKYFFWTSGSSFEYALSQNSWLKDMTHFCGPGNTQRILERDGIEPHVFLDHAQWLKEMSE